MNKHLRKWLNTRVLNKLYTFNKTAWVQLPEKNRYKHVFVFGSNMLGQHNGGAAYVAKNEYQAQTGVAQGPTGNCYAIPTVTENWEPMNLFFIGGFVFEFLSEAKKNPDVTYHLTPIGCGIAGYKVDDIAPMFMTAPKNVILPIEFKEYFLREFHWHKDHFQEEIKNAKSSRRRN